MKDKAAQPVSERSESESEINGSLAEIPKDESIKSINNDIDPSFDRSQDHLDFRFKSLVVSR